MTSMTAVFECIEDTMLAPTIRTRMITIDVAPAAKKGVGASISRWPQPELSIGERHGSLGTFPTKQKCWRLKDNSPAHIVWKQISKDIRSHLEDQHEILETKDQDLMIEMFMVGKDMVSCQPTILFACKNKDCCQKAMRMVHNKGILEPYPGVAMCKCTRLPVLLATNELDESKSDVGISFGWTLSDILAIIRLTHKVYCECQQAGEQYMDLRNDLRNLDSSLQTLREAAQESQIPFENLTAIRILKPLLDDLNHKFSANKGQKAIRSVHQREGSRVTKEELQGIQTQLETCTLAIESGTKKMIHRAMTTFEAITDPTIYAYGSLLQPGISIARGERAPPRLATMGGILRIYDGLYGLTVKHAFLPPAITEACDESDDEFTFFDPNESMEGSDEETAFVDFTSQGSISSSSNRSQSSKYTARSAHESSSPREESLATEVKDTSEEPKLLTASNIGVLLMDAPAYSLLDWALIDLNTDSDGCGLFLGHDSAVNHALPLDVLQNIVVWNQSRLYPKDIAAEPSDTRVLIKTGNRDHVLNGKLSGIPSFRMVLGTGMSQELWTVTCIDGTFTEGDCGSWVVDCESKLLYGHIVSGYPGTKTAYIVPTRMIFDEIAQHFGEATIPNPENWSSNYTNTSENTMPVAQRSLVTLESVEKGKEPELSSDPDNALGISMEERILNQPWKMSLAWQMLPLNDDDLNQELDDDELLLASDSVDPMLEEILARRFLRRTQENSSGDPTTDRETTASFQGAQKDGIPADARWTKISRELVNPEALDAGKENYVVEDDFVLVLRVLTREQIQSYAEVTHTIRAAREALEELEAAKRHEHELRSRPEPIKRLPPPPREVYQHEDVEESYREESPDMNSTNELRQAALDERMTLMRPAKPIQKSQSNLDYRLLSNVANWKSR